MSEIKQINTAEQEFDIDFSGHVLVRLKLDNGKPVIVGCINGYGDKINSDDIIITEVNNG